MSAARPAKAVSNRIVHHEVILHLPRSLWSAERYETALQGPIPDWSWQGAVQDLERKWPNGRVTVFRGLGRHRRKIYDTIDCRPSKHVGDGNWQREQYEERVRLQEEDERR